MPALHGINDPLAHRIVASAADLALVVDRDGTIVDVWHGDAVDEVPGWDDLVGRRWLDTVLSDSGRKVEQLLKDAFQGEPGRAREVNQRVDGGVELPLRVRGTNIDDEHVIVLGHDIRPLADLQQRMVSAQQAMDLEYRRLRQADTRYRLLFHVCSEGVLVVQADKRSIVEVNPAASTLLGASPKALQDRLLTDLFTDESRDKLLTLLGGVEAGAQPQSRLVLRLGDEQTLEVVASAATFRQSGSVLLLFRFWRADAPTTSARDSRMLHVLESMPEGFVVTDENQQVLSANAGFCDLVQRADESHVVGQRLDRWLGRPRVDLNIIAANLREHGVVRNFATILRGDFDGEQEAVVTAVSVLDADVPCFGFAIRPVASRIASATTAGPLPQSVEQLRALVGRVPLKEIVRESADLIERLCIGAALDVSGNNRAAAAQLLGLSRQSLYSKLRRHGMEEFQPS